MTADTAIPDDLRTAAQKLQSELRAEREAGEATLIAARERAVPALIEVLRAPVPPGSRSPAGRAALLLGALQARDALPALYELIEERRVGKDERPFVARALAEILDGRDAFDDRCRAALEALAAADDAWTRAFTAQAFGALSDLRSKARVQALAQDKDPWVREKAQAVLTRLAEVEAAAQQDAGGGVADFAALVNRAQSEGGTLKPFLDDLGDHRRAVRDAAIAELVRAGKASVPFLLERLNQPLVRARAAAATALGRIQAPEAAGPLLVAATMPAQTAEDAELRAIALRALAHCLTGLEEGLAPSIVPLARDKDRFVRSAALLCLGRLSDREGMQAVVDAIVEDDPFVVESAAVALSEGVREDDTALVRPLLVALDRRPGPRAAVREAILIALSRIAIESPPLRVRVRHRVGKDVLGTTASTRKAAIALLEALYGEGDAPPLTLLDDVLSRLTDDHPEVRICAASFVRAHLEPGMSGVVPRLQEALNRKERTLSLLCLEALRRHDTKDAKAALERAQSDADVEVQARAATLLVDFQPASTPWVFVPKTLPPQEATHLHESQKPTVDAQPARPERPSRVRPAPAAGGGGAVEAKFDVSAPSAPRPPRDADVPTQPSTRDLADDDKRLGEGREG